MFHLWCSPHVDLFATRWNTKLPAFMSPVPDPQVLAMDALSLPWQDLWAYAFPPHQLLTKILIKLPSPMHSSSLWPQPGPLNPGSQISCNCSLTILGDIQSQ